MRSKPGLIPVLLVSFLLGALGGYRYHLGKSMLHPLAQPYREYFPASEDRPRYTMQAGDILVGLREHGLWNPYPDMVADGQPIAAFEFTGGPYTVSRIYPVGNASRVVATYTSELGDSVSLLLHPFRYSDLVLRPDKLDWFAGYRKLWPWETLENQSEIRIVTYTLGCFGGSEQELFIIRPTDKVSRVTYRSNAVDTTFLVPAPFATLRGAVQTGIREVSEAEGGCVFMTYFAVKTGRKIFRSHHHTCGNTALGRVLHDLRSGLAD